MKRSILFHCCMAVAGAASAGVGPGPLVTGSFHTPDEFLSAGIGYQVTIQVQHDPGRVPYQWYQEFFLTADPLFDHAGTFGLMAYGDLGDGHAGRMLWFNLFQATEVEAGPAASVVAGNTLRILYDWKEHVPYTFRLTRDGEDWWRMTVTAPGMARIDVGRIRGPQYALLDTRDLWYATSYSEALTGCGQLPYARAQFKSALVMGADGRTWNAFDDRVPTYRACLEDVQGYGYYGAEFGGYATQRVGVGHSIDASLTSDFNVDRHSDVLWRNVRTGANTIWVSANATTRRRVEPLGTDWSIAGVADFNGDGRADVLWRNAGSGENRVWMSGSSATVLALPSVVGRAWFVAGIGRLLGGDHPDILWRNAATGATYVSSVVENTLGAINRPLVFEDWPRTTVDLDWTVAGIGDFNNDGHDDILWRNAVSGSNTVWLSGRRDTQLAVARVANLQWKVAGVGDFNGDGASDILWRNIATGNDTIWRSARSGAQQPVRRVINQAWQVAATGDYDGDGRSDIVWRNQRSGANVIWRSGNYATQQPMPGVSNLDWMIVD